jgi:hypothetical protein
MSRDYPKSIQKSMSTCGKTKSKLAATSLCQKLVSAPKSSTDLRFLRLLELSDTLCEARGTTVVQEYWIRCAVEKTGDDRISPFILRPEYDGQGYIK